MGAAGSEGEVEWSRRAPVPFYPGEVNFSQPIVPLAERQHSRATAITLSCKRQEMFFIALSGRFLSKELQGATLDVLLLLSLTLYLGVLHVLWPNPALCSLSPSCLVVSVSALGLSELARTCSQGDTNDIPHAEKNSTFLVWASNVLGGFQHTWMADPQVLCCTCAQVLLWCSLQHANAILKKVFWGALSEYREASLSHLANF